MASESRLDLDQAIDALFGILVAPLVPPPKCAERLLGGEGLGYDDEKHFVGRADHVE